MTATLTRSAFEAQVGDALDQVELELTRFRGHP